MGVNEVMKLAVEKLKGFLLGLENLGAEALAWFDNIFPPETRADKISRWFHVALPYAIAAAILIVLVWFCRCCCCGGRRVRMMKAPGRNLRMRRDVFESDPRGYFRNLRAHPGDELC